VRVDAVVVAGGVPSPGTPLFAEAGGRPKALIDVAGKPMLQWVLDALSDATTIENVVLVGLGPDSGVTCAPPLHHVPDHGGLLDNLVAGILASRAINRAASHTLVVSADIPTITGAMADWVVGAAEADEAEVCYTVVERAVMQQRFPSARRTWTRLRDVEFCSGSMHVLGASLVDTDGRRRARLLNARKSPLRQAAILGPRVALELLLGRVTLKQAAAGLSARMAITGRAVICPYAEVGMDVDAPEHLAIVREALAAVPARRTLPS